MLLVRSGHGRAVPRQVLSILVSSCSLCLITLFFSNIQLNNEVLWGHLKPHQGSFPAPFENERSGPFSGPLQVVRCLGVGVTLYPALSPALPWNGSGMTTLILIQPKGHGGGHDAARIRFKAYALLPGLR
jgi:hypothetical protein